MTPYLEKSALFPPLIDWKPSPVLGIVIVIPCYNESDLLLTFHALLKCQLPKCNVEVITIINDGITEKSDVIKQNNLTFERAEEWSQKHSSNKLRFFNIHRSDLPKKFAGVGLARKIGMDEAIYRFEKANIKDGTIVCFDADSKCDKNYLVEIEKHFADHPKTPACSIHYEHPLSGFEHDTSVYDAILDYELHLRYYVYAQRYAGFPYAYQTIGSSMAVRTEAYQKQGGMNRRKAGEDFYFLHKFTHFDAFTELKSTKVIPSPRVSNRVPFGTGKAVGEILNQKSALMTYNPKSFVDLKVFLDDVDSFYEMESVDLDKYPSVVVQFLETVNFAERFAEIKQHSASKSSFLKRFHQWFDAFLMMKYVHFSRDNFHPNTTIGFASKWFFDTSQSENTLISNKEFLTEFRRLDKE